MHSEVNCLFKVGASNRQDLNNNNQGRELPRGHVHLISRKGEGIKSVITKTTALKVLKCITIINLSVKLNLRY